MSVDSEPKRNEFFVMDITGVYDGFCLVSFRVRTDKKIMYVRDVYLCSGDTFTIFDERHDLDVISLPREELKNLSPKQRSKHWWKN